MEIQRLNARLRPAPYARDNQIGVVHLGLGAFHRAHQAAYFDALLKSGQRDWMIVGASLRSASVADQLNPQDGVYTILVRDGKRTEPQVCHAISKVLVAPDDPQALVDTLALASVALVTLTITEKGYCLDPACGELDLDDPSVRADISDLSTPGTALGFLIAGLMARRKAKLPPFTILSCDNLPDNGQRTKHAVLAMAGAIDPALADWIDDQVAFPSSMVDRIVPATTPSDISHYATEVGYQDLGLVKTEPFSQWVVEDRFCNRRPPLESVGVEMTDNVQGWENAKLRLLNGAHSALSYLGNLAGHEFVHQAIAAPGFAAYVQTLWDEAESTLQPVAGFNTAEYRRQLQARFANSALEHRTYQIAMDGSQKLPQRLLNSIRHRLEANASCTALSLGVAAWMRWQSGVDEQGQAYQVQDPLAERSRALYQSAHGDPAQIVNNLMSIREVFSDDLARHDTLRTLLTRQLDALINKGAKQTVIDFRADNGED